MEFPEGFLWGTSISGFQTEMGYSEESIDPSSDWWIWVHDPINLVTGLISGDLPEHGPGYWDLYRVDHMWLKKLSLNAFRMSIEWSRIFPKSTKDVKVSVEKEEDIIVKITVEENHLKQLDKIANHNALNHYRRIIEDLRNQNINIFICLNHFTLPIWIHNPLRARDSKLEEGPLGWISEETIIEFTKYAAYIAWKLGDLIDYWATFNEPCTFTLAGYITTSSGFPPAVFNPLAFVVSLNNIITAHARAYEAIKAWDKNGVARIGIIHSITPVYPLRPEDYEVAEHANYVLNMRILEALTNGEWDPLLIGEKIQRYDLKNKLDWIGINYYTRVIVTEMPEEYPRYTKLLDWMPVKGYGALCKSMPMSKDKRPISDSGWEIYPEGLRDALKQLQRFNLPIYITENGIADAKDRLRIYFIISHVEQMHRAIVEDKVNIKGYFHWSLMDNYEWSYGFKLRFGLLHVDYRTKMRTPRPSAFILKEIAMNNALPEYLLEYSRYPNILS